MKMHLKVKEQAAVIKAYDEGFNDLRRYLNSEKFSQDIMVNKNDVLLRISEMKQKVQAAFDMEQK